MTIFNSLLLKNGNDKESFRSKKSAFSSGLEIGIITSVQVSYPSIFLHFYSYKIIYSSSEAHEHLNE